MESQSHLMLAPDSAAREDMCTDVGMGIVAAGGFSALTMQAIGDQCGCTRQSVHKWFGGQDELRHVVMRRFAQRWRRWIRLRVHDDGLVAMIPDCEEVLEWCRVWLALVDHAAREPRLAFVMDGLREAERDEISAALGLTPDSDRVAMVQSLVEGLRLNLCTNRPGTRPDFEGAGRLLVVAGGTLDEVA